MNIISNKSINNIILFAGIILGFTFHTFGQQGPNPESKLMLQKENGIQDQYIIVIDEGFIMPFIQTSQYKTLKSREARAKALANYEAESRNKLRAELQKLDISEQKLINFFAGGLSGFTAKISLAQATKISKLKWVKWIEQDGKFRIIDIVGPIKPINRQTVDWGVEQVGSRSGVGKYAFVIDSGVDQDHPDLNVNRSLSRSCHPNESTKDDLNGHGTHVAGIIGAKDNLIGTKGVAAGATIVSVKALDQTGFGPWSAVISATSYTATVASAGDVVNYSLGASGSHFTVEWSIKFLLGMRGIYVTIAAGNANTHAGSFTPARVNGNKIFTISNMDRNRRITTTSSNFGNGPIDYAAPGQSIYSTYKNGGYITMSGTSMSAPHVAGIILVNNGVIRTNGRVVADKDNDPDQIASVN